MDYDRIIYQIDQIQFDFWLVELNAGIIESTKKEEIIWRILLAARRKLNRTYQK